MSRSILIGLVFECISASVSMPAFASGERLEDYGGAQPAIPCPTIDHPPSQSEATLLLTCSASYDNFGHGAIHRVFNVNIKIGSPRAYTYGDPGSRDIDPNAPIYPIRGVETLATCSPVTDYMQNSGKNCSESDFKGEGICYKTPYGDWTCTLGGSMTDSRYNQPPHY